MRVLEFDGYTLDVKSVNLIGKVEFSSSVGDGSYGFDLIVNGSKVRVGSEKRKEDAEKNRTEFVAAWKKCLNIA